MYNNPYQQANLDNVNRQIAELEKIRNQIQQPVQPITQNFQLAPNNNNTIRHANSIEEVEKTFVIGDTPFFSNDMSVLWVKNPKGNIKSYELTEIVPKDAKDVQIELLQAQINELKGMIEDEQSNSNVITTETTTDTTGNDETTGRTTKTNKSSSVSRVPKSKTR